MTDYNYEAAAIHLLGEPKKKQGDELNYFNPLAPDGKNPDFYVNIKTGAYNSFSSDHTGHFTELYAKQKDIDTKQAFKELVSKYPANGSSVAAFKKPNAKDYGYIYFLQGGFVFCAQTYFLSKHYPPQVMNLIIY